MKVKTRRMDPSEGVEIMRRHMEHLRRSTFDHLRTLFKPQVSRPVGPSGREYELETQSFWDDREEQNIRVIARLDASEGRMRRVKIVDDFIMGPDGSLIGES